MWKVQAIIAGITALLQIALCFIGFYYYGRLLFIPAASAILWLLWLGYTVYRHGQEIKNPYI